jgi:hypothetical protein
MLIQKSLEQNFYIVEILNNNHLISFVLSLSFFFRTRPCLIFVSKISYTIFTIYLLAFGAF